MKKSETMFITEKRNGRRVSMKLSPSPLMHIIGSIIQPETKSEGVVVTDKRVDILILIDDDHGFPSIWKKMESTMNELIHALKYFTSAQASKTILIGNNVQHSVLRSKCSNVLR